MFLFMDRCHPCMPYGPPETSEVYARLFFVTRPRYKKGVPACKSPGEGTMGRTNRVLWLACSAALLASVSGTRAPAAEKEKSAKDLDRTPVDCVSMSSISRKTAIDNRTI